MTAKNQNLQRQGAWGVWGGPPWGSGGVIVVVALSMFMTRRFAAGFSSSLKFEKQENQMICIFYEKETTISFP